jgi:predicted phosphodiesterase
LKIALISDLHSNREALEAVGQHIERQGIERIFCLGDVVGYAAEPEFCIDFVRERAEICLMGNHDEAVLHDASDFNAHARGAIEFTKKRMKPAWYSGAEKKARWNWLASLPLKHRLGRFLFVHGSPRDPVREYVLSTDGFLNPDKLAGIFKSFESVALGGHTHHPGMHDETMRFSGLDGAECLSMEIPSKGKSFINVGSVGQPRDGDNRACYAVLEEDVITWHRVAYDFTATMKKIMDTGSLSKILASRLQIGK